MRVFSWDFWIMLSKIEEFIDSVVHSPKHYAILSVIIAGSMAILAAFANMWQFGVVSAVFVGFAFLCAIIAL